MKIMENETTMDSDESADENTSTTSDEEIASALSAVHVHNNEPDKCYHLVLNDAVMREDVQLLDYLLKQGYINVNAYDRNGFTPLLLSLMLHRTEPFIMRLLEAGSDVNISTVQFQRSPLHVSIRNKKPNITHELIKRGADLHALDVNGHSPLQYAVKYNDMEVICMLLYYDVDVNI